MIAVAQDTRDGGPQRAQIPAFDAVRGLAALAVLVGHYRSLMFQDFPGHGGPTTKLFYLMTGFGHQAVIVFFVLSGYFVGGSTIQQMRGERWSWGGYLLRRLTRLYAVLLPALALTWLLDGLGLAATQAAAQQLYHGRAASNVMAFDVATRHGAATLAGNVVFLQKLLVPAFGSNGPLWSLAYEFWYYVLFPAAWVALTPSYPPWRRASNALLALAAACLLRAEGLLLFLPWLLGAGLAAAPAGLRHSAVARSKVGAILSLLIVIGACLVARLNSGTSQADMLVGLGTAPLILSIASGGWSLPKAVRGPCTWSGRASFTVYAFHFPIIAYAFASRTATRAALSWSSIATACMHVLLTLAALVGLWWLFEARTDQLRRWITRADHKRSVAL